MDHWIIVVSTFISVLAMVWMIFPPLLSSIRIYKNFSKALRLEAKVKLVSTMHSIWVTCNSIYMLFIDHADDIVWFAPTYAIRNAAISTGYLLGQTFLMLLYWKDLGAADMLVHHVVAFSAFSICLQNGYLTYFVNLRLIAELSTPFLNVRWLLATIGAKNSLVYYYNGLIFTAIFFLCRVAIIPYHYYILYVMTQTDTYKMAVGNVIHVVWLTVCVIIDTLDVVWFYKLIRGLRKYLCRNDEKSK